MATARSDRPPQLLWPPLRLIGLQMEPGDEIGAAEAQATTDSQTRNCSPEHGHPKRMRCHSQERSGGRCVDEILGDVVGWQRRELQNERPNLVPDSGVPKSLFHGGDDVDGQGGSQST